MDSPFTYVPISDEYTEELAKSENISHRVRSQMVVNPSGCVLPYKYKDSADRIYNFEVFPDDVWIVTFPKCGTTWTQEMVWLLRNNCDFERAKDIDLRYRVPFFEFETILLRDEGDQTPIPKTIDAAENLARPRCIKSHLPKELLPKQLWTVKPKIVYVARDPRDVVISYYHHHRLWNGYSGSLERFSDAFLNDRVIYGPYWSHLLSFLDLEDKSHILMNTYEEMKKDLGAVIRKTAKFLNVEVTDENVEALKDHLSFKNMKNNTRVNCSDAGKEARQKANADDSDENLYFIRKGESGAWKKDLESDIIEKFKKWNERHLKGRNFQDYPWS